MRISKKLKAPVNMGIRLSTLGKSPLMNITHHDALVSVTGEHRGVLSQDGFVFDFLHPSGIALERWVEEFEFVGLDWLPRQASLREVRFSSSS